MAKAIPQKIKKPKAPNTSMTHGLSYDELLELRAAITDIEAGLAPRRALSDRVGSALRTYKAAIKTNPNNARARLRRLDNRIVIEGLKDCK